MAGSVFTGVLTTDGLSMGLFSVVTVGVESEKSTIFFLSQHHYFVG
jgi:hypothetical protein